MNHSRRYGRAEIVVSALMAGLLPAASTEGQSIAGDVGPSFTESSAATFAGALQMATVEPSSGVLRTSVAIEYPAARGMAQPQLGLYYSSAAGIREAGMGWGLNLPSIERRGPTGGPPDYSGTISDFVFNGEPLVPLCRAEFCPPDVAPLPDWAGPGWMYFRLRDDTTLARFFRSPDGKTWRVQLRGGEILELGKATERPLPGEEAATELDVRFGGIAGRTGTFALSDVYRWNLSRRFEPAPHGGRARNVVVYRWRKLGDTGRIYLTDVYHTPPIDADTDQARLDSFAHHIQLEWTRPFQIRNAYAPIWRATPDFHVARIDVASKPFGESGQTRRMVRRYHLQYEDHGHHSYLRRVQMEGRCAAPTEEVAEALPGTSCPRLPAMAFRYSAMGNNRIPSSIVAVPSLTLSPGAKSLNLMPLDLNGDSLPDFVETRPQVTSANEARGLPPRRTLINNGTWHVQDSIAGAAEALTRFGYTVTGDYTSRGETGVWWYLPGRSLPVEMGLLPVTFIPRLGPDGWKFAVGQKSIWANHSSLVSGPGRTKLVGDINGDGLQDLLNFPDQEGMGQARAPIEWGDDQFPRRPRDWQDRALIGTWIARRQPDGGLFYAPIDSCFGPAPADMDGGWPESARSVHLADMNGDSLADFVVVGASTVRYWPSDGLGNFTACRGVGCRCTTPTQSAVAIHMLPFDRGSAPSPDRLFLADVNGDGYADFVSWSRDGLRVAFNRDGLFFSDAIAVDGSWLGAGWSAAVDEKVAGVAVADMNGNGINDIVTSAGSEIHSLDLHRIRSTLSGFAPDAYASRPGLLIEIDNGLGAQTHISYESTADMARTALATDTPWPEPMPQVMQVVQRLTTKTTAPGAAPIRLFYKYDDPAWDGWERRLRGFRKVTVFQGEPQIATESTYFIPSCPDRFCGSTAPDFERLRAVSGRLLTVEVRDAQKRYHSTVSYSYAVRELAGAAGVRSVTPTRVDTRLYDTTTWSPINGRAEQQIRLETREGGTPIWSGPVPVRARESQLLRISMANDQFGSLVGFTDHGRIRENGAPFDDPIVTAVTMLPARPDWRFLPSRARTEPFASRPGIPGDLPRRLFYDYDDAGRLVTIKAFLSGTLPLDRHHEDPAAAVAPPPPNASFNSLALLALYQYDDLGNIVRFEAPAGSCIVYEYDRAYGQWPVRERAALDGCTSTRMLSTVHEWDAGLETALRTQQPSGALATQSYDAFGRLVAVHLPDPKTATRPTEPSLTLNYLDQPGGPVQRVRTEQRTGSGASLVTWSYADGFGRRLLTLRPADPAAGDGGAWIGSGLPVLNSAGFAVGMHAPWFYSGDPALHPLTAPTTALSRIVLDSFGRPVEFRRPDNTLSGRRVYRPLQLESEDDAGRRTRLSTDGHGRLIEQSNGEGATESVISIDYLVGGEAARIVRGGARGVSAIPSVHPQGLVRWMQYDSLGRMVLNAEPNTAVGFRSDPPKAVGIQAWRYAYDWSGRLVGTSDARGCGWNSSYDHLGRMIATDLSPCLRSQAAYTVPNLADGTGTEAFYRYDAPEPGQETDFGPDPRFLLGRLVSVQDRAAHTRFGYDARGRLVGLARRLAQPGAVDARWPGADGPAARYANEWMRSAARYDDADRLTALTTGAAVPELLDARGRSEITFGYSARGVMTRIGGSYGALVTGAALDALGRPSRLQLGDAAGTQLAATYGPGGSLLRFRATRSAPALWTQGAPGYAPPAPEDPPSTQTVLEDLRYDIDDAGVLRGIDDLRDASAWPPGAKPVSRALAQDDRARVTGVQYHYADGADASTPPPEGVAVPGGSSPLRPMAQGFRFGGGGRVDLSTDDANALFDRSLAAITRGTREDGPDRLLTAANGDISAEYDAAGNIVSLTAKRGTCLDSNGLCSHRFIYDWDEGGRLARARRWDFAEIKAGVPISPAVPPGAPVADVRYRYDAAGARVLRSAVTAAGDLVHSAWPLAMLRLTDASYDADAGDYVRTAAEEEVAVPGLARVIHRPGLPGPSPQHTLLSVADHLGSTSSVIDKATGELVERLTYLPYGEVESAYRPPRWAGVGARERFAGKEEDAAVGLVSFGARYYVPRLGQWLSADPLTTHGLGLPDPNPYAYVSGRVMQSADANGMQPCIGKEWYGACAGSSGGSTGGFQIGFGARPEGPLSGGKPGSTHHYPSPPLAAAPRNSGVLAAPATIPFWQALGRPDTWAASVDPSVIQGFNAGVSRNEIALVGTGATAAAASLLIGGMGGYELGTGLITGAGSALRAFGASVYVTTARLSLWLNEIGLAQQGISIGAGGAAAGLGLSRVGRAQQIFAAAAEDVPQLGRSTISVGDLVNKSGVSIRVISTNRGDMLRWLQQNLVLAEGEYLLPWVRGAAHAELNGAEFGIRNGFLSGAFGTSIASCNGCVTDVVLIYNFGKGAAFTLDNPAFNIVEILLNPQFFHP
jgi:RHS repeat-associated protein